MTATATPRPVLVVRPAPCLDPPYDDEPHTEQPPAGMDLLPVDWTEAAGAKRQHTRSSGSVNPAAGPPAGPSTRSARPTGARAPARPLSARAAARRYVDVCVEVLNGFRPAGHLRPLTDPHGFTDVADQLVRRTVRVRLPAHHAARRTRMVGVRRVVCCEPLDGVVEAAAVLNHGDVVWAMALRMERRDRIWVCTLVQVI